jgi:NTP pyrophosphatase (non-canonical NTP hydrolase)
MNSSHPPESIPSPSPHGITVSGFQKLIRDRYYATDSARGTSGTFMWFLVEVGELATALHNNAPGKTPTPEERANLSEEFADVLAWLCTIANINGVDLEAALLKYTDPDRVKGVKP